MEGLMYKRVVAMVIILAATALAALLSGRTSFLALLSQVIMYGGLFAPMFLFPSLYQRARCRIPAFRRRA
jgi:ABC-type transport system involved in cytochrome c biogenesis permease subunit